MIVYIFLGLIVLVSLAAYWKGEELDEWIAGLRRKDEE